MLTLTPLTVPQPLTQHERKSDPNILAAIVNLERPAGRLTAFRGQISQPTTPRPDYRTLNKQITKP